MKREFKIYAAGRRKIYICTLAVILLRKANIYLKFACLFDSSVSKFDIKARLNLYLKDCRMVMGMFAINSFLVIVPYDSCTNGF